MLELTPPVPAAHRLPGLRRALNTLTVHSPLLICALFLLLGLVLSGDYGVGTDEQIQRLIAIANLDYILGSAGIDGLLPYPENIYGVSFELPLLLAERALGLTDYYHIHRLRLILSHLFFIAAAFCCYLLVYRLFNNRLLAIVALLLFLLHPRLYAHSFLNSKDLPFLSMFMIALYLLERAWRRDTVGAFVLLGLAVGVLTNLRIMGVMLLPAVLALRGFDLLATGAWGRRKHILVTAGVFALIAGLTPLVLSPYAWSQPLDYLPSQLSLTVKNPIYVAQLFQGESIIPTETPPHYALTWFAITTPPFILLLGLVGIAAAAGRALTRPRAVFGNTRLRFWVLLLACFILPLLAVAWQNFVLFDNWRHLYFIYAPFCLLAVLGLHWLAAALARRRPLKAGLYGLAGVGLGLIALQMAQLHPHQHIYFNFLVDRTTPEYLRTQYELDPWIMADRGAYQNLLERHPGETMTVFDVRAKSVLALPARERQRLTLHAANTHDPDYVLIWQRDFPQLYLRHGPDLDFNSVYDVRFYNNTFLTVKALDAALMTPAAADAYRELYRQAIASEPIIRAYYDVYLQGKTLTFIREDCRPGDRAVQFGVRIYPDRPELPPGRLPDTGSYRRLYNRAVGLDGSCLAVIRLPDYPIAHIMVGQGYADDIRQAIWEEWYSFQSPGLDASIAAIRQDPQATALRSVFEVFLERGDDDRQRLLYYKPDCSRREYETRFFLHIYPVATDSLPPERRGIGFANQDFYLPHGGGWPGGNCLAVVPLPDYPIAEIRTGQWTPEQGQLWAVELAVEQ